ncbi:MAG: dehydrogenase [Lysobacterales bacterium 69-70]|nr:TPM domain-containing protein [Xanthomonadaceae bacterium]ODU35205.1 MAG: dehydrogenase [Xanthomonadaceae bacterium SCN 69-320]ODV15791.1 MAG: dehydrogenase [Xanthomonadaceae bacterium SCN 69-25]OJY94105.1 MAG: dehydrogenase [Xanthomonadales bacterium 69-70]
MKCRLRRGVPGLAGFALVLLAALFTTAATAQSPQPLPPLTARVTDLTGTLDAAQRQTLESELAALEAAKGAQIAVLVVPTTQPEDIAAYAIRVFDAWRLGRQGVDDGVLLIVAKNDRRVRIEVARGLEAAIPDAAAARIIREYIAPRFREGDYYGGIHDALGMLTKLVNDEPLPPPLDDNRPAPEDEFFPLGGALFAALFLNGLLAGLKRLRRGVLVGAGAALTTWVLGGYGLLVLIAGGGGLLLGLIGATGGRYVGRGGGGSFGGGGFSSSSGGGGFSGGGGSSAGGGASGSW